MQAILNVVQKINFYLSDYVLIVLLIGVGLFSASKPALYRCAALVRVCAALSAISHSTAASRRAA